jgi:hypothetical protein
MALNLQLPNSGNGPNDLPFINMTGTDIAAGLVVGLDGSNVFGPTNVLDGIAVALAGADGALVIGVTLETLKAGSGAGVAGTAGRIRTVGQITVCTASGAVTAGTVVMVEANTGKVKTQTSAKAQIGYALTTGASGDQVYVMLSGAWNA